MSDLGAVAVWSLLLLVAVLALLLLRAHRQRRELQQRLLECERQAGVANQTRTRFLRTMSHELRTPLNGILGYAELIRDTSADPEARELGAIVHHSAEQLHALLGTLLDLAHLQAGRLALQLDPVDLPALLREVMLAHRAAAEARGLALSHDMGADARMTLVTDRARLAQVLHQLLGNALKFTERGSVCLALASDAEGVRIEVRDSGIGMSAAQLDALRSPQKAGTADYVHRAQGPGLGLALVHELATLLGAALHIESAPGRGTRVLLRLPPRPPAAVTAAAATFGAIYADTTAMTTRTGAPAGGRRARVQGIER